MLCFRRAAHDAPRAAEPRFRLGEVLWHLGLFDDAITCWREAAARAPDDPLVQTRLAEALLQSGDRDGARAVAAQSLAREPDNPRARLIVAIVAIVAIADSDAAVSTAADTIVECVTGHPALLEDAAIAGALAQALDAADASARAPILDAIVLLPQSPALVTAMPGTLVAQAVERCGAASLPTQLASWLAAARERRWETADSEAVRRIALAQLSAGEGADFGSRYAGLCEQAARAGAPLAWRRRTRGSALRVVAIAGRSAADDAVARLRALPPDRFAVTVVALDDSLAGDVSVSLDVSAAAAAQDARLIAALDPDVLVDLAGMSTRAGSLLAQRPARRRLTLATLPAAHAAPLVDQAVADIDALVEALHTLQSQLIPAAPHFPDAAELAQRWADAVAAHQRGDVAAARAGYAAVLRAEEEFAPARYLLGRLLADAGMPAEARSEFAAALDAAPDFVDARVAAVRAAIDAEDVDAAEILAAEGAARADPPATALLRAWGAARLAARDGQGAAQRFEAALARDPTDAETHYNHGVALQMLRQYPDAARAYQRALTFRPDLVAADFNLGVIFGELGNRDAAIHAFSNVLERDPSHAMAHRNLGDTLFAAGRFDEWRANFARFEQHCPTALSLAVHALEVSQWIGDFARVDRYLDGLRNDLFVADDPRQLAEGLEELLYLLLFFDVEPETYERIAERYDRTARVVYGPPRGLPPSRRAGRIRVGYLSADLRDHVMGKMIWQAIARHDRMHFDVRLYSLSRARDAWTERFEKAAEGFRVVEEMSDRAAADAIAADDLDLLVDLATHTLGSRPGIVALKPARVQITHVASAGIVGLSSVDFRLTDAYCDVPGERTSRSEALLPMTGCAYPYRHVAPADAPSLTRGALGIAPDAIVIGAFVTGMKLSRRCLALWRDVLARVPRARLAFSPLRPELRPLYAGLAAAGGIDAGRLVFVPQSADEGVNQARYRLVDFVLDPMPYGGVNGTLEALDMGVPVVTLVGRRHGERTSYSILANLGVSQTVAATGSEYVEIAVRLATDAAFMREVRGAIHAGLANSPLTDMAAHTHHLEEAYRAALQMRAPAALADAEPHAAADPAHGG